MKNYRNLFIILVFLATSLQATTYYVDSTNGDDSNNGTTPSTAWQTISKVVDMSSNFQPGDRILFKKGEIWNSERLNSSSHPSGTVNNPITYGSYGSGAKPIINLHTVQNVVWQDEGNHVWSTVTQTGSRFFKNGVEMLRAVDSTHLGMYGTEYYATCYDDACNKLRLYVYSVVDPAQNIYEWSPGSYVIGFKYANYINLEDLDFQGGASSSIRLYNNIGWKISNCNAGKNAAGGIKTKYSSNILIDSVILNSNSTVDMSQLPVGTSSYNGCTDGIFVTTGSSNIKVRNCYFKNWGHASFSSNSIDSLNIVKNIEFYNNELTAPDISYGGRIAYSGYSEDGEYYNNYIHNIITTIQLGGSRNHFHHNIIDTLRHSPLSYHIYALGVSLSNYNVQIRDNVIENNVIANTEGKGMEIYSINFDYPGEMSGNILRNNIIYNCGTLANDLSIQFHKDFEGELIYNNIVENNLIYSSNTTQTCLYQYNGIISDVATFNSQDTDIRNNVAGNPLFVDPENGDYHLLPNSPAVDAGTTTSAIKDFDGNTIPFNGTLPDIGAYEYYDDGSTPVELISFAAQKVENGILLNWETATEVNNYGFEVQRSVNSSQTSEWETIGFVEGHGNSNSSNDYSFVDSGNFTNTVWYRLKQIDFNGDCKYSDIIELNFPKKFKLFQNYPNPFNPITTISYSIPSRKNKKLLNVNLKIYDVLGQEVEILINKEQASGNYNIKFDASELNSGIYFYKLDAEEFSSVKKMILMK